jgi:L-serine dehydratase
MAAQACAIAIKNTLGLVCDPVAGLVEVPCIKRNAGGAANAIVAAELALAGIESTIPVDEVIVAMKSIGDTMPSSLKETALGGLAATPTAKGITKTLYKL